MKKHVWRVALIGCGAMGAAHLDDIYEKDNVVLSYVCDLDGERAKRFAKRYGAQKTETDWRKVVEAQDTDIVIIATYPSSHLEILKECIKGGKHVLCEKPISKDLESGREMVELIKAHPETKVLIGYILRHNKTYQRVAEMIQNDAIGKPIVMRMSQNHHTVDWKKYLTLINETSPILDCGVHYIDVMRWFTGAEITKVSGIGQRTEADVQGGHYNYGFMTAKLSDGSIAYYEAGWGNTVAALNTKEFIGPKGRISIVYRDARYENREEGDLVEYYTYPEGRYETINIDCKRKPTGDQLEALINMIENNSPANPTIDDVWESFKIAAEADKIIKQSL